MPPKKIEWVGLGETAAADAAAAQRRYDMAHHLGPDLSAEACACGQFGPWGDGSAFYCDRHAPAELRYAAQFFAETIET